MNFNQQLEMFLKVNCQKNKQDLSMSTRVLRETQNYSNMSENDSVSDH